MIYTSYHARVEKLREAGIVPINISIMKPRYVKGPYLSYMKLAPKRVMLKMEISEYNRHFKAILNELDPRVVIAELKQLAGSDNIAICCYEKDKTDCHRSRVADWLFEAGIQISEWHPAR